MHLAGYYALLGEKELAIETVRKALDMGYSDPYFPLIIPAFQSIRFELEFRTLFGINTDSPGWIRGTAYLIQVNTTAHIGETFLDILIMHRLRTKRNTSRIVN